MTPRELRVRRTKNERVVRRCVSSIRGRVAMTDALACAMFGHAPEGYVHLSPALHAVIGVCARCGEQMSESNG